MYAYLCGWVCWKSGWHWFNGGEGGGKEERRFSPAADPSLSLSTHDT